MGERAFSKQYYGKETKTTHGTAVPATRQIVGAKVSPISADRKPRFPEEDLGVRAKAMRSVIDEYLAEESLSISDGYFQILPMLFSIGLKGDITPSEQTPAQGDYLWTHTPSLTGSNTLDSITLEKGDDVQAFEAEYVMAKRIRISGQISQSGEASPVAITADLFGRQWTPTTFTAAISIPTVTPMNSKLARFYLDSSWAGVGGTEKTILRGYDIDILGGAHPVFYGSDKRTYDTHGESYIEVMGTFTFEGNSDADAIFDAFQAQSLAVARLKIIGPQIGTGAAHSLTLDMGGVWEEVVPLSSEAGGNNLHSALLHGLYDITGAKVLQAAISTNLQAM
jgi:hypothetical protein